MIKKTETTYENGMRHIHVRVPFLKTLFLGFYVKAGSANEYREHQWGISHYLEHMLFNGSEKYPAYEKTQKKLAELGVIENAWTWKSMTNYYLISSLKSFPEAYDILLDRVFHPILSKKHTEKERGIILEEINMRDNQPPSVLSETVTKQLFSNTTYAHEVLGSKKSISEMKQEYLKKYHNTYYSPNNCQFVTYGGAKYEQIKNIVDQSLSRLTPKKIPSHTIQSQAEKHNKKEITIEMDVRNSFYEYSLKLPKIESVETYLSYLLFAAHVGYGEASLFNQELRIKKSLVSSLSSDIVCFRDTAFFYLEASMDEKNNEKIQQTAHTLLENILQKNTSRSDFTRMKNYLKGFLYRQLESSWFPADDNLSNITRTNFISELHLEYMDIINALDTFAYEKAISVWKNKIRPEEHVEGFVIPKSKK